MTDRTTQLEGSRLDGADLTGADLRGADLSCVDGLTPDQLRHAIIDNTTMMPPGLEHLARDVPQVNLARHA